MGSFVDSISDDLADWIAAQPMFFVATAPVEGGHVNVSPKGLDTFRVLGPTRVAYLDLTGSGVETIAHLRQNRRITIMFCAFTGPPGIVRLFGIGTVITPADPAFSDASQWFPDYLGTRSIIAVDVEMVGRSCGFGVPEMDLRADRSRLLEWAEKKGRDSLPDYWNAKNATSIDGLPGLAP